MKTFYPELGEKGVEIVESLIDKFKKELIKKADEAIRDLYCDVTPHIEADQWTNFRTSILNELSDYRNSKSSPHDYKRIRRAIYEEHKEEINKDLNKDLLDKIKDLQDQLERSYK